MKRMFHCCILSLLLLLLLLLVLAIDTTTALSSSLSQQQHQQRELFSVAPMMAHTTRYYRYFFRQLSHYTHLYTEMIPATQIVQAYETVVKKQQQQQRPSIPYFPSSKDSTNYYYHPEYILQVIYNLRQQEILNPSCELLDELLRFPEDIFYHGEQQQQQQQQHAIASAIGPPVGPTTLQLGGRDPDILAKASSIGIAYGYNSINLNCGCPSTSVSGRNSGVSLMNEPYHVAQCLEQMSYSMEEMDRTQKLGGLGLGLGGGLSSSSSSLPSSSYSPNNNSEKATTPPSSLPSILSVKHRLGVATMETYNAQNDSIKNDDDSFKECHEFVRLITLNGSVSRIQVHARLGLLSMDGGGGGDGGNTNDSSSSSSTALWVPNNNDSQQQQQQQQEEEGLLLPTTTATTTTTIPKKVNHKREQYKAKQRARAATISNRNIPPLRPNIINHLASDFPHIEFVTNGGMKSITDIQHRVPSLVSVATTTEGGVGGGTVTGAMVGRAVINHPCSFAAVDQMLWGVEDDDTTTTTVKKSRQDVLQDYITYCEREEERIQAAITAGHTIPGGLETTRQRMVGAAFHLFVGEEGNNYYQRRLRKLVSRAQRHTAHSMLQAAVSEVPTSSQCKPLTDYVPLNEITNDYGGTKRSGRFQTSIH